MEELDRRLRQVWNTRGLRKYPGLREAMREVVLEKLEKMDDDPHGVKATHKRVRAPG